MIMIINFGHTGGEADTRDQVWELQGRQQYLFGRLPGHGRTKYHAVSGVEQLVAVNRAVT